MVKTKALNLTPTFSKKPKGLARKDVTDQNRVGDWKRGNGHGFDPLGVSPATPAAARAATHPDCQRMGPQYSAEIQNTNTKYTHTKTQMQKYKHQTHLGVTPSSHTTWLPKNGFQYTQCRIKCSVAIQHVLFETKKLFQNSTWAATHPDCTRMGAHCSFSEVRFPHPQIRLGFWLCSCCANVCLCVWVSVCPYVCVFVYVSFNTLE